MIVNFIPLLLPESPDLPPDFSLPSLPTLPTTLGPGAGNISIPVSAEDWARRSMTAVVSLSGEVVADPPLFLSCWKTIMYQARAPSEEVGRSKLTLSGDEDVEEDRKPFFSLEPLILELLSCFRFLGFFDVLESSSERLRLMSRLEEEEEPDNDFSSRSGMISNPAAPAAPPPEEDIDDFLDAAAAAEEDPGGGGAAADMRSCPASGMMDTEGLMSACGPMALEAEVSFILVSWNSCLIGSRRTDDSLEVEEEADEEGLAVDFRLGFPASGFNAVSRGPYSFKDAVLA